VFVRTPRGFVVRPVTVGTGSDAAVPIISGLRVGERVATVNAFVLKAELGKAEAEHDH
jgi:cobalt-zinc-cadmium efflux system membrane fusion protein